ncbi:MAG: ABC transporter permease [Thermomicrobiales bacterium]
MAAANPSIAPPAAAAGDRVVHRKPFVVRNARVLLVWGLLILLLAVYVAQAPQFRPREQRTIANSGLTLAVAGLGQTMVVLTGGIDLSVGPMVSLTNSVASAITPKDNPGAMWKTAVIVLAIGALGGMINGALVAYGRLQPIIVTLATASVWSGIALYVRPQPGGFIPPQFSEMLSGTAFQKEPLRLPFGLSWSTPLPKALFVVLALVALWMIFRQTRLATRIFAVGSSEGAAYMSGVDVARAKMLAYTLAGLAAGAAGLVTSAQTSTGNALAGNVLTLNSIAAVVLGGASLAGGAGTYLGTLAGAYVIALIPSVLFFFGVSPFYQQMFQGSILLVAVSLGALGVFRIRNRMDRL